MSSLIIRNRRVNVFDSQQKRNTPSLYFSKSKCVSPVRHRFVIGKAIDFNDVLSNISDSEQTNHKFNTIVVALFNKLGIQ